MMDLQAFDWDKLDIYNFVPKPCCDQRTRPRREPQCQPVQEDLKPSHECKHIYEEFQVENKILKNILLTHFHHSPRNLRTSSGQDINKLVRITLH